MPQYIERNVDNIIWHDVFLPRSHASLLARSKAIDARRCPYLQIIRPRCIKLPQIAGSPDQRNNMPLHGSAQHALPPFAASLQDLLRVQNAAWVYHAVMRARSRYQDQQFVVQPRNYCNTTCSKKRSSCASGRVRAALFQRVLRCHHDEQFGQGAGHTADGDLVFLQLSRADCTLGGARLISSASTISWNNGPAIKRNIVPCCGSRISVPVKSPGIKSGVNWMR